MPIQKQRQKYMDIAKAIAILCIIAGHTQYQLPVWLDRLVFSFHVPLFYIVSGYFLKVPEGNYKDFFRKNVRGLLVPYLRICLLIILTNVCLALFRGTSVRQTVISWVSAAFYGSGALKNWNLWPLKLSAVIGASWFLLALFWGRLIAGAAVLFSSSREPVNITVGGG